VTEGGPASRGRKEREVREVLVAAAVLAMAVAGPLWSQGDDDDRLLDADVVLGFGGFLLSTDTTIRLDGETAGSGTEIDLERDLGFEDADRFRFDGLWRISPRHHLRGAWFEMNRDAERRVERNVEFGDIVIPISSEVTADLSTSIAQLSYEYAFLRRDSYEIAGSIGVHRVRFELDLSATVGSFQTRSDTAETSAPLPVIGLRGLWRLGREVYLDASAQYFAASIDEYDGDLQDFRVAIVWMPWRTFGFGAGYNHSRIDLDVEKSSFNGELKWEYGGAILFGTLAF
jgi:hypothetical protein